MSLRVLTSLTCVVACALVAQETPNHLEPIPPTSLAGSLKTLTSALIPGERPKLWMICDPAFVGEYSISVVESSPNTPAHRFSLRVSHTSIKISMPPPPPPPPGGKSIRVPKFNPAIHLTTREIPLPLELESVLFPVWSSVVKQTRYESDRPFHVGCDGVFYFFNYEGYFGGTWTPDSGIPLAIVKLGEALVELVESAPSDRSISILKVKAQCTELQAQLNNNSDFRRP